jgi:hypothetical protein
MAKTQNAVMAMTGAICLGMLAGGTIPTRIKSPFGSDWRDIYSVRADPTTPTYYVEPGPEDLSTPGDGPFALADNRPTWLRTSAGAQEPTSPSWMAAWHEPEPMPELEPALEPVPQPEPPTSRRIEPPAEPAPIIAIEAPETPLAEQGNASGVDAAGTLQGAAAIITL